MKESYEVVPVTVRGQIRYICPSGEDTEKNIFKKQKCPPEVDIFAFCLFAVPVTQKRYFASRKTVL